MGCTSRVFMLDPAVLRQRVSWFCDEFKGGQGAAKAALRDGIYSMPPGVMRLRAIELKTMLGWTETELHSRLRTCPKILTRKPSTIANNVLKLQAHGFTSVQALHISASIPHLAAYDWSSPLNVERLQYLMLFLQLSADALASRPIVFTFSLQCRLGPRIEFSYRSRGISPDVPIAKSGCFTHTQRLSDANFAARFNNFSCSPPLIYDEVFKQHWHQRWES